MPEIAKHTEQSIASGAPKTLTRAASEQIGPNRRAAMKGQPKPQQGKSRDEFPFASSDEGGKGSFVAEVPVREQSVQGGILSSFYSRNGIKPGDQFTVEIVD